MTTFAANVKKDGLFIVILVVDVGAVPHQQLDEFDRGLVAVGESREVEGGLPKLDFQTIDDDGIGRAQNLFHLLV